MSLLHNSGSLCDQNYFLRFDGESACINQISLIEIKILSSIINNQSINKIFIIRD